jgi:hypothetical protein
LRQEAKRKLNVLSFRATVSLFLILAIKYVPRSCFLATFYFIHALLPRLMLNKQGGGPENEKARDEIVVFLGEYGSYLKMDTCLAYAAVVKAGTVVDLLLSIAKHDPRHREVIKQTSKSTSMVFYEPVRNSRSGCTVGRLRMLFTQLSRSFFSQLDNAIGSIATAARNPEGDHARAETSDY